MATFIPNAAPTGLGSMPFTTPEAALDQIDTYFPEIPYWPQLPQRSRKEGLIHQVCGVLLDTGLLRLENGRGVFARNEDSWADRLTDFYGILLSAEAGDTDALNRFGLNPDTAAGYFALSACMSLRLGRYCKSQTCCSRAGESPRLHFAMFGSELSWGFLLPLSSAGATTLLADGSCVSQAATRAQTCRSVARITSS